MYYIYYRDTIKEMALGISNWNQIKSPNYGVVWYIGQLIKDLGKLCRRFRLVDIVVKDYLARVEATQKEWITLKKEIHDSWPPPPEQKRGGGKIPRF